MQSPTFASHAALLALLATLEGEVESLADALAETEDQMLALYELNKADPGRLDIDRLLQSLVRQAMRLVKAGAAFAVLAPARVACSSPPLAPEQSLIELFERVQAAGGELLLRGADLPFGVPAGEGNLFIAPLPFHERPEIVAALGLWLNRPAAALSPDLKLARSIAEQAGAQLEIALLHEQLVAQARLQAEMELARAVQLDLLPRRSPAVARLDVYGVSRPALQVGGDFFDYFVSSRTAGRPFTFAVGDVSGKGLSAALLMAMTRTNLRGSALRAANSTPATILAQANEDLYDDFTEVGMMATVFVGQYDPAAGRLAFANAGHSPVILCPAGGPARLLEADGPAMGVLPISLSQDETIPFQPGDVLVVATDGFNEERNSLGEFFGIDRLLRQVELLAADSPQAIADDLLAAVARFAAGTAQDDDQTIVVLKGKL
jgi:phosphoserine phosphatase RsbU/P